MISATFDDLCCCCFFYFRRTIGKTIVVGDKLMTSTPDFAYPLATVPKTGRTLEDCRLLFIVVVIDFNFLSLDKSGITITKIFNSQVELNLKKKYINLK